MVLFGFTQVLDFRVQKKLQKSYVKTLNEDFFFCHYQLFTLNYFRYKRFSSETNQVTLQVSLCNLENAYWPENSL